MNKKGVYTVVVIFIIKLKPVNSWALLKGGRVDISEGAVNRKSKKRKIQFIIKNK